MWTSLSKRIAAQRGLNVKTVRRYVAAAQASGVVRESALEALDDDLIAAVVNRVYLYDAIRAQPTLEGVR